MWNTLDIVIEKPYQSAKLRKTMLNKPSLTVPFTFCLFVFFSSALQKIVRTNDVYLSPSLRTCSLMYVVMMPGILISIDRNDHPESLHKDISFFTHCLKPCQPLLSEEGTCLHSRLLIKTLWITSRSLSDVISLSLNTSTHMYHPTWQEVTMTLHILSTNETWNWLMNKTWNRYIKRLTN